MIRKKWLVVVIVLGVISLLLFNSNLNNRKKKVSPIEETKTDLLEDSSKSDLINIMDGLDSSWVALIDSMIIENERTHTPKNDSILDAFKKNIKYQFCNAMILNTSLEKIQNSDVFSRFCTQFDLNSQNTNLCIGNNRKLKRAVTQHERAIFLDKFGYEFSFAREDAVKRWKVEYLNRQLVESIHDENVKANSFYNCVESYEKNGCPDQVVVYFSSIINGYFSCNVRHRAKKDPAWVFSELDSRYGVEFLFKVINEYQVNIISKGEFHLE